MEAQAVLPPTTAPDDGLVGRSAAMLFVRDSVQRVARAPRTTVLVTGETGTGKELVARAIHARSSRAGHPFVAVNCATLSGELFASELFGHEAGAFTGAQPRGKRGLLAAAEGGTLFLDEIGELDLAVQAQLLRVLQERVYRPLGATREVPMDVRIVVATHRDLQALVDAGRFREDLWYRLNVASIHLPTLRERAADVPELCRHLLERIAREHATPDLWITDEAVACLAGRTWPGNVRELAHELERAAIQAGGAAIEVEHLSETPAVRGTSASAVMPATSSAGKCLLEVEDLSLEAVERALIRRVLAESNGNRSLAARTLGMHRATLHGKLRALGLAARAG
ncbi:MAG: sigma 54-interacting transcriptional regulator [Planctomycetes bacterium]|nr:sigma 54-interacting transcriptional regulator [Planctomycetota bacterium]